MTKGTVAEMRDRKLLSKFHGKYLKRTVEIWEKKVLQLPVASHTIFSIAGKIVCEATGDYIV
ncbi:hypothetical protein IQ278_32245 [Tolypothrix sp. LEGE 11397]|uniref:hypothetical protein n=1 Tax=Tolypothrix sp. LEGE 11397 TaxID=2777971 RepID=UPI000BBC9550|nr:hypothetical protein [Tolypothrix sp. LEGE 11397]